MKLSTVLVIFHLLIMAAAVMVGDMELLLVQAIWRHGDRAPTKTFRSDPFQEANWTFGGGGFGELSPIGMKQQMELGMYIRKRYIDDMKFLSPRYSSKEIYVRSTDRNRTIISAMSNIIGMYGPKTDSAVSDVDYPSEAGWPAGFVPVAIHTVDGHTDYVANPDADCDRQDLLWSMAQSSEELQEYRNRTDVASLLANLTEYCGQTVDFDNFWIIRDALLIEQIHANDKLRQVNPWFSDELFKQMTVVHDKIHEYQNGVFEKTLVMNGLDIGKELLKIRGGSMTNDLKMHMDIKLECLNKSESKCKWINGLKYYAYSAHDSTIYALYAILGIQSKAIIPYGYPEYAAATFIELWRNRTNNKPYFKLVYHHENSTYPVTQLIKACEEQQFCNLDVFRDFAEKLKPDQPMDKWCYVDPRPISSSYSLQTLLSIAVPIAMIYTLINS